MKASRGRHNMTVRMRSDELLERVEQALADYNPAISSLTQHPVDLNDESGGPLVAFLYGFQRFLSGLEDSPEFFVVQHEILRGGVPFGDK